jgi:hypothetical protein
MARAAWKNSVGRRSALHLGLGFGALLTGCTGAPPQPRAPGPALQHSGKGPLPPGPVAVWSWFDLPADDPRARELSAAAWEESTRTLWSVQDERPVIVPLVPDEALKTWRFGEEIPVKVSGPLDLEGIVAIPEGFIIASEDGPRIIEVDRRGTLRHELRVPARFNDARYNKSLESLTLSPSGRFIFTASEVALERDGKPATAARGTMVRILRLERDKGEVSEHAYVTDPAATETSDHGVSDMAALSDDELLVLERGWAKGTGNTVRIYRVSLEDRASCLGVGQLTSDRPVLSKTLFADIGKLPFSGTPASKQPQQSPLLDNYEGIALGPWLPDGRRSLLLVTDDNGRSDQIARVLVLAVGTPT